MDGIFFARRRKRQHLVLAVAAVCVNAADSQIAFGQGAGFVKGENVRLRQSLKVVPSLDQHAVFGRGADTRIVRQRNGNDNCARTRRNKYHQSVVYPLRKAAEPEQGRKHRYQQRYPYYRGRVNRREPRDEFFLFSLVRGGVLNEPQYPCRGAFGKFLCGFDPEQTVAVYAAAQYLGIFRDALRQALAGQGGVVDRRAAVDDYTVERYPLMRLDRDNRARPYAFGRDGFFDSVKVERGGIGTYLA